MARYYEVVVFGDEESSTVQEICEALDPDARIIIGRLGHESTLLNKDGKYIKDLSYMNRDIKDIVCIDFDDAKFDFHKRNVVKVPKWEGEDDDRVLLDMIPFLEHLADPRLDVRKELDRYGHDNPFERFRDVQSARRSAIMQQRQKGFGGMMDKFGANNKGSNINQMNQETNFNTSYKPE
jgi:import inner membrane translocase subunit TIM50